jgi:hypothetical protein
MPTVESLPTNKNGNNNSTTIISAEQRDRSRSKSNDKLINTADTSSYKKRNDEELPLSFASFYYSLKVLKGKGNETLFEIMLIF